MTARELRRKYIDFFISKGHDQYPSGSLIPYDVTGKLDESLLFNGAGMVQFKPFFRGVASPPNPRLTNAQKVVRTGDIEEVGDDSHLTFFEMLGNFSFGDYFKAEAIGFSWEFLTSPQWLGLDPRRLSFTVFEEDDEAYGHWAEHLASVGIDPSTRIFRLDEEKNFWPAGSFSSGPPGPCGPNSEMFYWTSESEPPPSGAYTRADWWRDSEEQGKWLEIWNDVFIQYEWKGRLRNPNRPTDGYEKEGMPELPFRSIDTGMGLERTITALTGKSSIYDNDLFYPIFRALAALGAEDAMRFADAPADDRRGGAGRVIADHIRTACFCIADGILPANSGRGYVLRRLIRRAVLKGQRVLGFEDIFLYRLYTAVAEALGDHYTELVDRKDVIVETLRNEEALFRRTLHSGSTLLSQELQKLGGDPIKTAVADAIETLVPGSSAAIPKPSGGQVLPGDLAFKLYDTYGFPLEVTEELATEAGVSVDLEGYEIALRQAQERSRGSSSMDTVYAAEDEALILSVSPRAQPFSTFVGYDRTEHLCEIVQISPRFNAEGLTTGQFQICLDETPFYAESGGQITDTGTISCPDFELHVERVWKEMGLIWHDAQVVRANLQGSTPGAVDNGVPTSGLTQDAIASLLDSGYFFRPVEAKVDAVRRRSITRNHSATHLLHAALREVLGKHVTQAGSLVAPDYLRFDFTHGKAMTSEELAEVERIVNGKALEGTPVTIFQDIPIAEAKARGAMALFGEKYGDRVRMVDMGPFSIELCGGCHVRQTSEIGLFKILSESSAASGVRRIEAITGERAYEWTREQSAKLREAATLLKATPNDLTHAIERTLESLREEKKRVERMRNQAPTNTAAQAERIGPVELAREKLTEGDAKEATLLADRFVEGTPNRVALIALVSEGKLTFICKVGAEAQAAGAHAGNLLREVAKLAGGGGGGRPDFATAGGRDVARTDAALAAAKDILAAQVGA